MSNFDDAWGSPFHPFGGKRQRDAAKAARERAERERHRLRGCGSPACPICNPETANAGASGGGGAGFEDIMRRAIEAQFQGLSVGFREIPDGTATSSAPQPPDSYRKARKAVKAWIATAPDQAFEDIVGNEEALGQLRDAIQAPVKHEALYTAYGMRMPRGALLSGPPGCGKTMFARAAAAEIKRLYGETAEYLSLSGAELQSMFVGETERRIKAIFTYAREYRAFHGHPLLVFMDEAEVILPDRTGRVRRVAPWEESQVATFLAEMDGILESGAFVLLASNRPEVIDQAVLRDGRCDFKIVVQRPTPEAVRAILARNFEGAPTGADDVEALVSAAVEMLYDPHKVIRDVAAIGIDLARVKVAALGSRHFLLEHIVSGAMAASIPGRAKRYAFARDKETGEVSGVTVADVIAAVNDLFRENKDLDHAFALDEFKRQFLSELPSTPPPRRRVREVNRRSAPGEGHS